MLIQELNHLESVASASVVYGSGGRSAPGRVFNQTHNLNTNFNTTNRFETIIKAPSNVHNLSASAGAKGDVIVGHWPVTGSYTKADTLAIVDLFGNSTSYSASAALITP